MPRPNDGPIDMRKCKPISDVFKTAEEAHAWLKKTHCTGDCEDGGTMVISLDGGP